MSGAVMGSMSEGVNGADAAPSQFSRAQLLDEQERLFEAGTLRNLMDFAVRNPEVADIARIEDLIVNSMFPENIFDFAFSFEGSDKRRCVQALMNYRMTAVYGESYTRNLVRLLREKFPEVLSNDVMREIESGVTL